MPLSSSILYSNTIFQTFVCAYTSLPYIKIANDNTIVKLSNFLPRNDLSNLYLIVNMYRKNVARKCMKQKLNAIIGTFQNIGLHLGIKRVYLTLEIV